MFKNKLRFLIIIGLLIIVGFVIRIYKVNIHPPLNVDEYSIGYNAYSIAQTNLDEWGVKLPLFFKAFGDFKSPLDIYFVAILFKFFGSNIDYLRIPSVIFGTLYIPVIYLLLTQLTKNKFFIFLGTFLMAFSNYGIFFSRTISASISQSFFIFLSITLFIYFLKKSHWLFLAGSILSLGISLYAYVSSWIIAPLLCIAYLLIVIAKKRLKLIILFVIFGIAFIPILRQYFIGGSKVRLTNVSYKGIVLEINEFRSHTKNDVVSKILHNKPIYYTYTFVNSYIKHFDMPLLAYGRETHNQDDPFFPILFFATFPFYFFGLFHLFKRYRNPVMIVLIIWILISPFPSAITDGGLNTKRFLSFLGSDIILIIIGLEYAHFNSRSFQGFILFFLIILQAFYLNYYYFYPYQKIAEAQLFLKANKIAQISSSSYNKYDYIVYTDELLGEPQIYPLLATFFPPKKYLSVKRYECHPWCYISPFDKFFYDNSLNNIINFLKENINTKQIIGYFSKAEIITLKKSMCFDILNGDFQSYFLVKFKTCQTY